MINEWIDCNLPWKTFFNGLNSNWGEIKSILDIRGKELFGKTKDESYESVKNWNSIVSPTVEVLAPLGF